MSDAAMRERQDNDWVFASSLSSSVPAAVGLKRCASAHVTPAVSSHHSWYRNLLEHMTLVEISNHLFPRGEAGGLNR